MGALTQTGRVLQFDQAKGYGFVTPSGGGEDVFIHANDFVGDKRLLAPGTLVKFDVVESDRGLKGAMIRIVEPQASRPLGRPTAGSSALNAAPEDAEGLYDVLSGEEFRQEITELLLTADPTLTAAHIVHIRARFTKLAMKYGWIDNDD